MQLLFSYWCPGGDSNSHAIRRYHLKIVCLPIPPPGHSCFCMAKPMPWQAFFSLFGIFSFHALVRRRKTPFLSCRRKTEEGTLPAPARVDRSTACGYTAFYLMSSGNRTAVAPPTPPGPKGSNGNGCCRVSGSQKGAALLRLFCCLLTARQNREKDLFRERSRRLRVSTHFFPRLPMNRQHLSAGTP